MTSVCMHAQACLLDASLMGGVGLTWSNLQGQVWQDASRLEQGWCLIPLHDVVTGPWELRANTQIRPSTHHSAP